jgi:hypothetical protein
MKRTPSGSQVLSFVALEVTSKEISPSHQLASCCGVAVTATPRYATAVPRSTKLWRTVDDIARGAV